MRKKIPKIISTLLLIPLGLLVLDYYLPPETIKLRIDDVSFKKESSTRNEGRGADQQVLYTYFKYVHSGNTTIALSNFRGLGSRPGDSVQLTRSKIYRIQLVVQDLRPYSHPIEAEHNPFVLKGVFILLPVLLAAISTTTKDYSVSLVTCILAVGLYFINLLPQFVQ